MTAEVKPVLAVTCLHFEYRWTSVYFRVPCSLNLVEQNVTAEVKHAEERTAQNGTAEIKASEGRVKVR